MGDKGFGAFSGLLAAGLILGALFVLAGESAAGEGNPVEHIDISWASFYNRGPEGGAVPITHHFEIEVEEAEDAEITSIRFYAPGGESYELEDDNGEWFYKLNIDSPEDLHEMFLPGDYVVVVQLDDGSTFETTVSADLEHPVSIPELITPAYGLSNAANGGDSVVVEWGGNEEPDFQDIVLFAGNPYGGENDEFFTFIDPETTSYTIEDLQNNRIYEGGLLFGNIFGLDGEAETDEGVEYFVARVNESLFLFDTNDDPDVFDTLENLEIRRYEQDGEDGFVFEARFADPVNPVGGPPLISRAYLWVPEDMDRNIFDADPDSEGDEDRIRYEIDDAPWEFKYLIDGWYALALIFPDDSAAVTPVWFGVPDLDALMNMPAQAPNIIEPAEGATVENPVTFEWDSMADDDDVKVLNLAVYNNTQNFMAFTEWPDREATSYQDEDPLDFGEHWAGLSAGSFYAGEIVNPDGISYIVGKYRTSGLTFNVAPWTEGSGTEGDPYIINNVEELQWVNLAPDAHFALGGDIDASGTADWGWNEVEEYYEGFDPIGSGAEPFTGSFDGGGYVITGLFINRPHETDIGLFASVAGGAVVENVGLVGVDVTGECHVGGLAGRNEGLITTSYVTGAVEGDDTVGGLVGLNSGGEVYDSYAFCDVTGNTAGGLLGTNYQGATIGTSYAAGAVSGGGDLGGLVGFNDHATVMDSFWNSETTGQLASAGSEAHYGKTTFEMTRQDTFGGWDFGVVWSILADTAEGKVSYPYLRENAQDPEPGLTEAYTVEFYVIGDYGNLTAHVDAALLTSVDLVLPGLNVDFSAEPDSGQLVKEWTRNGEVVMNSSPFTGLDYTEEALDDDIVITVEFETVVSVWPEASKTYGQTLADADLSGEETNMDGEFTFDDPDMMLEAGTYDTIAVTFTPDDADYEPVSGTVTVTVEQKELTIGGSFTAHDKPYDGTTDADIDDDSLELIGVIGEDDVVLEPAAEFAQARFGNDITVNLTDNSALSGDEAGNYILSLEEAPTTTANITVEFAGGDGSEGAPYQVVSPEQLDYVRNNLGAYYILNNDIDLADYLSEGGAGWDDGAGWRPISNNDHRFTGSFDGQGHIIIGLFIERPNTDYIGLFGFLDEGEVRNVGLVDVDVIGYRDVGGLVGCKFESMVSNCYVAGHVRGDARVGGLVGFNGHRGSTISNSYAKAAVNGRSNVGGLVGNNTDSHVLNSYSTGHVSGTHFVGGLLGSGQENTVENSFWDKETSGTDQSAGGEGRTTAQMMEKETFTGAGWDVDDAGDTGATWRIYDGDSYPLLRVFMTPANVESVADDSKIYDGEPYSAGAGYVITEEVNDDLIHYGGTAQDAVDAGTYSLTTYSEQQGYDLIGDRTAELTVEQKELTVTNAEAQDKTYDGTADAVVAGAELSGVLEADAAEVELENHETGTFAQAEAGEGIDVTTAMTITGDRANNYTLLTQPDDLTADITRRELTIDGTFTAQDKIYDGTVTASIDEDSLTLENAVAGDDVNLTGVVVEFVQADAGDGITVNITYADLNGDDAHNYSLSLEGAPTAAADIMAKELIIGGTFTAYDKPYDGTTGAVIKDNNLVLLNFVGQDDVDLIGVVVEFAQANAGEGIMVNITDAGLDGDDAHNYTLSLASAPTATADILAPWTLNVADPVGHGTTEPGTGDHVYSIEEDVEVLAKPADGWELAHWRLDDQNIGDANPINVDGDAGDEKTLRAVFVTALQGEINRAEPGDTIEIGPGDFTAAETLDINVEGVTLRSTHGRNQTFIDAEGGERAMHIRADDVTVEGFTIRGFHEHSILIRGDNVRIVDNVLDGYCEEFEAHAEIAIVVDGTGARIRGNSIEDAEVGIGIGGSAKATRILNNRLLRNTDAAIMNEPGKSPEDTRATHNNIVGNGAGAVWDGDEALKAANNWWGHRTGPYHETDNPDGVGDGVSGNVEFRPWTGAESKGRGTSVSTDEPRSEDPEQGLGLESDGGEASASVSGENPTGVVFDGADEDVVYTQLVITDKEGLTSITLDIHYREPSSKVIFWFDDEQWVECSHQEVFDEPLPGFEQYGYDGYIRITIGEATSPSLDDFSGRTFAVGSARRPVSPVDRISGGSGDCFIATAAFGSCDSVHVEVLRRFRDMYLLTNRPGTRLVETYYAHSPRYASAVAQRPVLRTLAAAALLPVAGLAFLAVSGYGSLIMLLTAAALLILLIVKGRKMMLRKSLLTMLLCLAVGAGVSHGADINHFETAPGEDKTVVVPTADTVGEGEWSGSLFYSLAGTMLEGRGAAGERIDVAENQHLAQASLAYGVRESLQVSLSVPYVIDQDSDLDDIDKYGLGDLSLAAKYTLPLDVEELRFAVAPYVNLDTGSSDALIGSSRVASGFRLIADRDINENLKGSVNVGYRYQSRRSLAQININHSLLFGAGLVYDLPELPVHLTAELFGRSESLDDSRHSPFEGLVSAGYDFGGSALTCGATYGPGRGYGAADWRVFTGLRVGF